MAHTPPRFLGSSRFCLHWFVCTTLFGGKTTYARCTKDILRSIIYARYTLTQPTLVATDWAAWEKTAGGETLHPLPNQPDQTISNQSAQRTVLKYDGCFYKKTKIYVSGDIEDFFNRNPFLQVACGTSIARAYCQSLDSLVMIVLSSSDEDWSQPTGR